MTGWKPCSPCRISYFTTPVSPTYIWILTNRKEPERKGKVQLIGARQFFIKMKKSLGNKCNKIGGKDEDEPDQIGDITPIHGNAQHDERRVFQINRQGKELIVSKIFDNEDFGCHKITVERPLKLTIRANDERIAPLGEQTSFKNLASSKKKDETVRLREIEAGKQRQEAIRSLLKAFGKQTDEKLYKDRKEFLTDLKKLDRERNVRLSASELKAVLAALAERDESAEICRDHNGNPEPDTELRDTETVPFKESIEEYFKREILPHVPDAWINHDKTNVGYGIPFNRHFYRYEPPRPLEQIEEDIKKSEGEIIALLREVTA